MADSYWCGALVGHYEEAGRIINFSRTDPSDLSVYIAKIDLDRRWKKQSDRWTNQQPTRPTRPTIVPGPVLPTLRRPRGLGIGSKLGPVVDLFLIFPPLSD